MALTAKENSGPGIEPIPEGVYVATCYAVIDLGTHTSPVYGNERRKVLLQWEIPEVRGEFERDGKKVNLPRAISQRYTLSLSEKANLRSDLEAWRGRKFTAEELNGFDLKTVLGAACQLQIVHEASRDGTKTFANVAAIMAVPKGTPKPKPENPPLFFSFEDSDGLPAQPPGLPEWVAKVIMESAEWKARSARTAKPAPAPVVPASGQTEAVFDNSDDVPF